LRLNDPRLSSEGAMNRAPTLRPLHCYAPLAQMFR